MAITPEAANRHIKDVGHYGENGGDIDGPDDEVPRESRSARLPFEDQNRTEEPSRQPRRRKPPDNLEDANCQVLEVWIAFWRCLGRQGPGGEQHDREAGERGELREEPRNGVLVEGDPRHEKSGDEKRAGQRQRVGELRVPGNRRFQDCLRSGVLQSACRPESQAGGTRGQLLTLMALSTEIAPGADQAVIPASRRAFQVVTFPVSLILPPRASTRIVSAS